MKTAIIKTDFWKSDKMAEISIDARMTYLCILTSPERNGTPVVKVSNRMLTFYTGFNQKQVEVSLDHLQENGLIKLFDGYIIINNQDWVEPKKGKLSKVLYEKEMSELPDNIKGLLLSGSREAQECISISISKGISNSKSTSYSEFKNVKLTDEEYQKLTEKIGVDNTNLLIEELGGYIASTKKKYASHYATLQNWARRKINTHIEKLQTKQRYIA